MDTPATRLLLVTPDTGVADRVRAALAGVPGRPVDAVSAGRLDEALGILAAAELDVAMVDLWLVDADGGRLAAFRAIQEHVPDLPVIVLHPPGEEAAGLQAVIEGAADHLSTGSLDPELVDRAIRYAIERQQLLGDLRRLALVDDTTRIANRRGFVAMSEGLASLAQRTGLTVTVLYLDVDGLGEINEAFGRPEGDRALQAVAKLLRGTFRASDVIARLGGDKFGVLLLHDGSGDGPAVRRLGQTLATVSTPGRRYELSLSLGVAHCTPGRPTPVEELIEQAAEALRTGRARRSHGQGPGLSPWAYRIRSDPP
ncbi:MAG TPA: diguanylate cyclase [Actinomycetes bacterium]|jgi:diguanylate cyclase (GGDEF)-like protein|nr:diguanylate cyclase [Actinomycetes bacterium]